MIRPHFNPLSAPSGRDPGEAGFAEGEGLSSLFNLLTVYRDIDSRRAALNMAIDEVLLEFAKKPSIRFYRWDHPALSFGYFGRFADVKNERLDLVRRWTGGGIVFHGEDLTYSLVIPRGDPAFAESSMLIYEKTHAAICDALAAGGHTAELANESWIDRRDFWGAHAPSRADFGASPKSLLNSKVRDREGACAPHSCFANPVRADVLSNGRKVAGAAQRRTQGGLLQQGSIQGVDFGNGFADLFAKQLCDECRPMQFDDSFLARAHQIAEQKYSTEAWLRKH